MSKFDEQKTEDHLRALHLKEEEDLAQMLALRYNIPYLNLDTISIDADAVRLIPEEQAREAEIAAIQTLGKKVKIAIRNANSASAKAIIEELKSKHLHPSIFLVSRHSLEKAWDRYKEAIPVAEAEPGVVLLQAGRPELMLIQGIQNATQLKDILFPLTQSTEERHTSGTLEIILGGALNLDASDIHIEPEESSARLRMRIDGVLQDVLFFSHRVYELLLGRIKLLSGLKLNIKSRAQDGRFTIRTDATEMEIRTSALPGPHGETIVMRILNPRTIRLSLEDLGMQQPIYKMMALELTKPNGMILTTGPTGSGKTTTLYAFLKTITTPDIKIITIEDPIEYHIAGLTQTQVDAGKGYDFSNGLRSILRQDPDVILVGEIRDTETAEIAMHAALTGHLVFSTLHTNNAAGTIPRLIDLGIKPNIIAPAINIAMAQRLVRRLCTLCRESYTADAEELQKMEAILTDLPTEYKKPDLKTIPIWRPIGCDKCNMTGYRGRVGVFEVFQIDDAMEQLIMKGPSEADVRAATKKQGMLTMQQDGILKIVDGTTSWHELLRAIGD